MGGNETIKRNKIHLRWMVCISLLFSVFTFSVSPPIFASNKTSSQRTEISVLPRISRRHANYDNRKTINDASVSGQHWFLRWVFVIKVILKLYETLLHQRFEAYVKRFFDFRKSAILVGIHQYSFCSPDDFFTPGSKGSYIS